MRNTLSQEDAEDLLEYIGCTKIGFWKGSKISACCPVHNESRPSFGVNIDFIPEDNPSVHLAVCNCFQGDTLVITRKGVKPIKSLVNKRTEIINGNGEWEKVVFKSYGYSRLWKLVLTSNSKQKVIYATANHEWLVQKSDRKIQTKNLKKSHKLQRMWLKRDFDLHIIPEGLRHGFIFGDGSLSKYSESTGNYSHEVCACTDIKYKFCIDAGFDLESATPSRKGVIGRCCYTVPYNAKMLPDESMGLDYLYSFLIGYFVADGNCTHQSIGFHSSNLHNLEVIKHFCTILGIATYPIGSSTRKKGKDMGLFTLQEDQTMYVLRLVKSTIPESFWISEKKPSYSETYNSYLGYRVVRSVPTARFEEVFCCETSTHSFVLDGFILTGNCFSCGFHGTIPWLLVNAIPDECPNVKAAERWIKERYGVKFDYVTDENGDFSIKRYEDKFDIQEKPKRVVKDFTSLAPFRSGKETYQYFFDRGFTKEDMKEYMIGRDIVNKTVTIPVFYEDHQLAGVIGRYIDPSRKKNERYKIYEFQRSKVVFPADKLEVIDDTIIGCEGQFDAMLLHKWGYTNAVCMMGAEMSREQAEFISRRCRKYISLHDNDERGITLYDSARKMLRKAGSHVSVLRPTYYPPKGKDPTEWGRKETRKVIESAYRKIRINRYE